MAADTIIEQSIDSSQLMDIQLTQIFKKKKETNPEKIKKDQQKKHVIYQTKENVTFLLQEAIALRNIIHRISDILNIDAMSTDLKLS